MLAQVEEIIDIHAPIAEVFEAITDPRRIPEWNPNIIEVSPVSYPIGVGSTWRQVTSVAGRPMNLTCRVVRFERPNEGVLEISGDQSGRTWTICTESNGYTRVRQGIEFRLPGGSLGQMASGFVRQAVRRELSRTMARQREVLERDARGKRGPGTD